MSTRRTFLVSAVGAVLAPGIARAQAALRPKSIAFSAGNDAERLELFRQGMSDLGYVESRDFRLEFFDGNWPDPEFERQRILALAPDILVSGHSPSTLAFARLAPDIPIVSANMTDDVALQVVGPNYGRPQGNVTGVVGASAQGNLWTKYYETAHNLMPSATTVGVIVPLVNEAVARTNGDLVGRLYGFRAAVEPTTATSATPPAEKALELDRLFSAFAAGGAGVIINSTAWPDGGEIARRSSAARIPVLHNRVEYAEEGGLIALGLDTRIGYRRAAYFVDQIFRGSRIADLPLERNGDARLLVNLRAAREQGFEIPLLLLARADVVIE